MHGNKHFQNSMSSKYVAFFSAKEKQRGAVHTPNTFKISSGYTTIYTTLSFNHLTPKKVLSYYSYCGTIPH